MGKKQCNDKYKTLESTKDVASIKTTTLRKQDSLASIIAGFDSNAAFLALQNFIEKTNTFPRFAAIAVSPKVLIDFFYHVAGVKHHAF